MTLMMTSAQIVETSVSDTTNSPSQEYNHPNDHTLLTYDMTPGFKPFNPLSPNSNKYLMSPYNTTTCSNIQVMRIEKMGNRDEHTCPILRQIYAKHC